MTRPVAYYRVMAGLPGCMPNSIECHAWETRHAMAQGISDLLDVYGFSQRNRRQINIPRIWRYIQTGGMRGHFVIRGNMGNATNLEFEQLTSAQYAAELEYGNAA